MGKYLDLGKIALIAIIILAFALRIYRLDHHSVWYDEGVRVILGDEMARGKLKLLAGDGHLSLARSSVTSALMVRWFREKGFR